MDFSRLNGRLLPLCLLLSLCTCDRAQNPPDVPPPSPLARAQTVAAIFAHPDDETTVAPLLARLAREGKTVHLIITTDGRYGATDHSGIPAGDSLVAVRREELICSAAALGIEPPVQYDGKDMLGSNEGMGEFFTQLIGMEDALEATLDSLRPDAVITFGADGDSGHPDHRLTADVVTELLLSGKLPFQPHLYYFSYTREQADRYGADWNLNYADPRNLTERWSFTPADADRYYAAIHCHESQYSAADRAAWIELERANPDPTIYLRPLVIPERVVRH